MWETVAKWVALVAICLGLVGVPVYFYEKKLTTVAQASYKAGYQAKVDEDLKITNAANEVQKRKAVLEQDEAQRRLQADTLNQKKINLLQGKLNAALQQANIPPICKLDVYTTSLLRNSSIGDFTSTGQPASPTPSGPTGKVS